MPTSLRPVAVAFIALGSFLGSWAVVAADVEHALGVSHGGFGLLLAVALAGTAATGMATGPLVERWGTPLVLSTGLVAFGLSVGLLAVAGRAQPAVVGACIIALFAASGVVDVTANVASAAALAHEPGRLVRFHAFFNAGAAAGAASAALVAHVSHEWRLGLALPAVALLAAAVACHGATLPAGEPGDRHGLLHSFRTVRSEGLVVLAVIFACSAVVEGGIDTWGVLVLREQFRTGLLLGAAAQVVGQLVATGARATLGPAAGALGTARGVAVGSGLAAVGLALVGLAPTGPAIVGLVLAAAGVSVCWPMLIAHASAGIDRPAGVVSGVTATGYMGFVVGPAVIGLLAEATSLRAALLFLAGLALVVAVSPRLMREPSRAQG